MPLSPEEKAWLGRLYDRNRGLGKYAFPASAMSGLILPVIFGGRDLLHALHEPSAGKHLLSYCLVALLAGFVLGAIVVQTILLARLHRREEEMLAFAEKHFPDECSWKQEEMVLRQAEDLQRQAKAGNIVASALRSNG